MKSTTAQVKHSENYIYKTDAEYSEDLIRWYSKNKDTVLEQYQESVVEFPDDIYEGVWNDQYEEAEERYVNNLEYLDVPDTFIQARYESMLEIGDESNLEIGKESV